MARKETIAKDALIKASFDLTRAEGIEAVTARKLANFCGCSTQPIFRHFSGMEELYKETFNMALAYFDDFYKSFDKLSPVPFVNLGLCYIAFAGKEPKLFSYLFMKKNDFDMNLYNLLNGRTGAVMLEMNKAKEGGVKAPEMIFMKMWMLIHGAACMTITGDFDLSSAQTRLQLEDAYKAFVR